MSKMTKMVNLTFCHFLFQKDFILSAVQLIYFKEEETWKGEANGYF